MELCNTLRLIQTDMLKTMKKTARIFIIPGEAKMCLGFISFCAPPTALKRKNYHNIRNMQPIVNLFQGLFKFMNRHLLVIFSTQFNVFCLCYRHASFFPFFNFNKFPSAFAFYLSVEYDKTKQTPSNKI